MSINGFYELVSFPFKLLEQPFRLLNLLGEIQKFLAGTVEEIADSLAVAVRGCNVGV
jgi:hypothetical protein